VTREVELKFALSGFESIPEILRAANPEDQVLVANIEVVQSQSAGAAPSGVGAVAGGVVGGVLGHQVGSGRGNTAATIAGAVGGALLGNAVESNNRAPRTYQSYRVSVQTDNGGYRAFDVPSPGDLRIGDRVRIDNGQISRF